MFQGLIIARYKPGSEQDIARIFAESDAGELPQLAKVKRRRLFVFHDVYLHLIEGDDELPQITKRLHQHELFADISRKLEPFITPYDPETWRGPADAAAREIYRWDAPHTESQSVNS